MSIGELKLNSESLEPDARQGDAQTAASRTPAPPLPGPLSAEFRARSAAMRRVHETLMQQTNYLTDEQ